MKRLKFMPAGMLAITADSLGAEFACRAAMAATPAFDEVGDFAVVTINGPLMQHHSFEWDSYEAIALRIGQALASSKPKLLLKLCSPGGQVAGAFELADNIRAEARRAGKPVIAYVDGMAASAAYALACSAERIVVPQTGIVGSIGCMQMALDATAADRAMGLGFEVLTSGARKADGNPHVAMTDDARGAIQAGVIDMAETFFACVARARPLSVAAVERLEAAVFVGAKAVEAGLADEVMTFAELVATGAEKITAQTGAEQEAQVDEKEVKSALKAIAEGDDEKAAARAKKALAAYDDEESKADDEKKDDEAKSEDDGEKPKDDDEKKDADAKASASKGGASMALAAKVQSLLAWKEEREEKDERAKLMASRTDLASEVVALLERSPIDVVRDAVKTLPRGTAKGSLNAARAAIHVTPTLGAAQGDDQVNHLPATEARSLDEQMGLARRSGHVEHVGTRTMFHTMTPAEARAELARKAAENTKKEATR